MIVGFKTGCFVNLHPGHIECLEYCRSKCDGLIILLNDDKYIEKKYGRIITTLGDRLKLMRSLDEYFIWYLDSFSGDDCEEYVQRYIKKYPNNKYIMFHSEELKDLPRVPCQDLCEIQFVPLYKKEIYSNSNFCTGNRA